MLLVIIVTIIIIIIKKLKNEKKKMKITLYQPQRKIYTVTARAEPKDLGLKSHPKDYQQKLTYNYGQPSKHKPRPMLLNPNVLGGWP